MAHTSRGIWYPSTGDSVRPASRDFKDQALTTNAAIDNAVQEAQWYVRALVANENLNDIVIDGGYDIPTYTVANSLRNRPTQPAAVDRARLNVYSLRVGSGVAQVWTAISASGQEQIRVERRRDNSGTWTPWLRTDNWQERRPLVAGEDLQKLEYDGLYTVRTYAISVSLVNRPQHPDSVQGANVIVRNGESGRRTITWETIPAAGVDAPIMQSYRDNGGNWSDWRRIDHHVEAHQDLNSLATAAVAVENVRKTLNRHLALQIPDTGDLPLYAWSAPAAADYQKVPTHEGSGSVTHPSILHAPGGWKGYEYWMAFTPYPMGREAHEDPNIVASNDGDVWVVPAGLTNPIDDQTGRPDPHNSDTNLAWGPNGELVCTWRMVDRPNGSQNVIVWSWSLDGVTWSAPAEVMRVPLESTHSSLLAPSLFWLGDRWRIYGVSSRPSPNELIYFESTAQKPTTNDWGAPTVCETGPKFPTRDWWHQDIQQDPDGGYYGVMQDVSRGDAGLDGDLFLMRSSDGDTWEISEIPLIPKIGAEHDSLYKSVVLANGSGRNRTYDVWYAAFKQDDRDHRLFRTVAQPVNY